jgi:hypothetical protein
MVLTPFDSTAVLNEDEAVWPFTTGSVSVISSVTRRQFDRQRPAFEGLQEHLHAVREERLLVADHIVGNGDLLVGLGLHEVVPLAVRVEVLVAAVIDFGLFDHFDRAPAEGHLHAVRDAAHIDLGHRVALAGVDVLRREDHVELAVLVLDDVALAQRRGDDLDHYFFLVRALAAA